MDWSRREPQEATKSFNLYMTKINERLESINAHMVVINQIIAKYDKMIMEGIGEEE